MVWASFILCGDILLKEDAALWWQWARRKNNKSRQHKEERKSLSTCSTAQCTVLKTAKEGIFLKWAKSRLQGLGDREMKAGRSGGNEGWGGVTSRSACYWQDPNQARRPSKLTLALQKAEGWLGVAAFADSCFQPDHQTSRSPDTEPWVSPNKLLLFTSTFVKHTSCLSARSQGSMLTVKWSWVFFLTERSIERSGSCDVCGDDGSFTGREPEGCVQCRWDFFVMSQTINTSMIAWLMR